MIEIEIDGTKVQVAEGSTVMDAANGIDVYIPHFCYHKKLSIAANCRMCLVEVEKAPKPLPACATPVTPGMVVRTASARAKQAQRSVMEFLLINHPLDCPICDQGGECQLQDLAVGYGGSASRYDEPKRVVFRKNIGPLVAAEEMSRCIQCTRCVRFGQEVAGLMELGMVGRGEHSEIMSFVDRAVESEISGNMIDICPVGALTSKPFRYQARTWELARRRSVSGHDALGSNLVVQVKNQRVMRVVPFENEAVNSCWLSDRDRFSYEGLYAADRLSRPMIKERGQWREVEWSDAIDFVGQRLRAVVAAHGADAVGALASPGSTLEELALLARLVRGLGSDNIDFRLRHADFGADGQRAGAPWLGMPVSALDRLDRVLLVGSFLRKDHPLLAVRLRDAARRGGRISIVHAVDDDLLMPLAARFVVRPDAWVGALAQVAVAVAAVKGIAPPAAASGLVAGETARSIAQDLASGKDVAVLLGNAASQSPQAAQLHAWAQWIADATGARLGFLGEAANSVGGYLAQAVPAAGGHHARAMLESPRRAYLLWNLEPEYDTANPALAMKALAQAESVIAFSPYRNGALEYAEAILPISTFFETSGTFVNTEGLAQSFNGACRPFGEARPGWKVLRVLGELLGIPGFDAESSEDLRDAVLPRGAEAIAARLSNRTALEPARIEPGAGVVRVADVGGYFTDAIVRRAEALRATRDARPPRATANAATLASFGVAPGDKVRARQGDAGALLECALDAKLPDGVVRVPAGHAASSTLGAQFGPIVLERA
ncbi:MAG TPA: NADH-quinone oxidoreductase subunit NuoG [Burkholderiaceae bacterium]|nr:NADH-quinone oxidoreductase subunit NuoG [Burkholderiaceae bacterium]